MARELWKGNEAVAEAAVRAGCRFFFGYPITPQNEIPEYLSWRLPQAGGCFLQAESEVSAINMVYGASGAGARVMTSSSSPGISLKQEGISYMCACELPAVIVNMMRAGPGLGSLGPSQSDYFQATRGGGNGDYRTVVLAPSTLQEAVDLMQEAFDIADQYRNPVVLAADGMIGQMMEPIEWREIPKRPLPDKEWATDGVGPKRDVAFIFGDPVPCEQANNRLAEKYAVIEKNELRWAESGIEGAQVVIAAYGTIARVAEKAIRMLADEGIKVGLFRPITLWPYPYQRLHEIAGLEHVKSILSVEMSFGQMVDDVKIAVAGQKPVHFQGRAGGVVSTPAEIVDAVKRALQ